MFLFCQNKLCLFKRYNLIVLDTCRKPQSITESPPSFLGPLATPSARCIDLCLFLFFKWISNCSSLVFRKLSFCHGIISVPLRVVCPCRCGSISGHRSASFLHLSVFIPAAHGRGYCRFVISPETR